MRRWLYCAATFAACSFSPSAAGAYVTPMLGGGQVNAPMKHADITFDGVNLDVHVDSTVSTPVLRPLSPPDAFDPAMPWAVLQDKAYNLQYGWNPAGFFTPPPGAGIWIEQISSPPELEVYFVDGPPASIPYDPIFGTDGSSRTWKWSGAMIHNAYAVLNPSKNSYDTSYKVYIGDAATGIEMTDYGSAEVTFRFEASPVLLADFDDDGDVDGDDFLAWQTGFGIGSGAEKPDGDYDEDGDVDGDDFLGWQSEFGSDSGSGSAAVPEPTSVLLLLAVALGFVSKLHVRPPF